MREEGERVRREGKREREKEGAVGERGGRRVEEEKEEDGESWEEGGEGEKEEIKGTRTGEKTFYTDILHLW